MSAEKPLFQFTSPNYAFDPAFVEQMLEAGPDWLTMAMVSTMPEFVLIMDHDRKIVFANANHAEVPGIGNIDEAIGKRVGDVLNCIHVHTSGGCGATKFCRACGHLRAILSALNGRATAEEYRITTSDGRALDMRVFATPLQLNGEQYCTFAAKDVSDEKRRRVLERIFFHDVLKTAETVTEYAEMIRRDTAGSAALSGPLMQAAQRLVSDIDAQRQLLAAERGELTTRLELVDVSQFLTDITRRYADSPLWENRHIRVETPALSVYLMTDPMLLGCVIENMVQNALEASQDDETITVRYSTNDDQVTFAVNNAAVMPRNVQVQIFKRSFTTKGEGHGLGTYAMKLLSKRYLKGRVWFTSDEATGTTFYAAYSLE